jgi:hypothetical protein
MMSNQGRAPDAAPVPLDAALERTKALLADAMRSARSLRAFEELLQQPDRRERRLAWELALQHVWPVPPEGEAGRPTAIVIQNHILRPPKEAIVEICATPAARTAISDSQKGT